MNAEQLAKIKEFLQSVGTGVSRLDENGVHSGDLDLSCCRSLTSITFPEGMAIGGDLDLSGCSSLTSVTFPEGMAIGGNLNLYNCRSLTSITFPEGMAIGGDLDLGTTKAIGYPAEREFQWPMVWEWRDRKYIKADGIFSKLISHRGNVYRVAAIGSDEATYLVTDGGGKWAHGDTLEEARRDLIYKISNRDTSRYEGLTLDSELTHEEAIECYRVITGACSAGTRNFCEKNLPDERKKERYMIRDIIELTRGHYGADTFREFFKK